MNKQRNLVDYLLASIPVVLFFIMGGITPALANDDLEDEIMISDAHALHASEMESTRGGFFDHRGHIYRFAVDVKTQVDGSISYARSLVLQAGKDGNLHASSSTQLIKEVSLPVGTIANVINSGKGLVVDDQNGKTTILNQTEKGGIASVIMNTANNRNVSQTIDINILLNNTPILQAIRNNIGAISALAQSIRTRTMGIGR